MLKRFTFTSITLFFILPLVVHVSFAQAQKNPEAAEYEIYNVVAQKMYLPSKVKFIVIKNMTGQFTKPQLLKINNGLRQYMPGLQKDTLFNFVVRNEKQSALQKSFKLRVPYDFIDAKKLFTHEDWVAFNKKYPKARGVLTLSRVGYNAKKTQAFMVIAYQIYAGLGEEIAVMLKRHKGLWVIQQKYTMFKN